MGRGSSLARLAALASAVVLLAGCSSGGGDSPAASGAAGGKVASGTPIKFGVVSPVTGATAVPAFQQGVKAAAAYVNNQLGGVNGHPLEMVYCDDQGQDPSKNAACVQKFVANNVIAILNMGTAFGTASLPIATAAGISTFTQGSDASEVKSKHTIILHVDAESGYAAVFSHLKKQGKTSVGSMVINFPETTALYGGILPSAARKSGVEFVRMVVINPTATDFTPELLKASQGADIVTMSYGPAQMAQTLQNAQAAGVHVQFAVGNAAIDQKNFVQPAGSAAEGVVAYSGVDLYNSSAPQAVTYRDQMEKAGFGAGIGGMSEQGFSFVMTAHTALSDMKQYTPGALRDYFNSHKVPVYLGQVYDASKTPFPDRPAIHVTAARVVQVKNGQFADVGGDWIDTYGGGS
ncbi:ABC transporter substrate-binding protein [Streptomyces sp. NPDC002619]|uniref:ABC transporter substrate-binding protein n=1 Tax=Streptomyces sp. NPDC002619 TaxID=3364655 RepID=UPI00369A0311